jgi:pimeloyl-ACP methyl ester carboxylesterase
MIDTIMREFWHAKLATMNSRWLRDAAESMAAEPDRSTELTAARSPALVVHGQRDRRLWWHDADADMARRLGAGHVVIEKASHSPNMERPARLAAVLTDFWAATSHRDREPVTAPR